MAISQDYWSARTNRIFETAEHIFASHEILERNVLLASESVKFCRYVVGRPGTRVYRFTLSFLPGWVFLTGDVGHLAASRVFDMQSFCRDQLAGDYCNLDYFGEKVPKEIALKEFTSEAAMEGFEDWLANAIDGGVVDDDHNTKELAAEARRATETEFEWSAFLWDKGDIFDCDYPNYQDWTAGYIWQVAGIRRFFELVDDEVRS